MKYNKVKKQTTKYTHLLWANLAVNEAILLRGTQQSIKQQDKAIVIRLVLE
jgi:hypothetical protein